MACCSFGLVRHLGILTGFFTDGQAWWLHLCFIGIDAAVLWALVRRLWWGHNAAVCLFAQQTVAQTVAALRAQGSRGDFSGYAVLCCAVLLVGLLATSSRQGSPDTI